MNQINTQELKDNYKNYTRELEYWIYLNIVLIKKKRKEWNYGHKTRTDML